MCDKIHGKHGLIVMHMLFLEWDESEPLEFNARSFDLPCWLTKISAHPKAMINFSEKLRNEAINEKSLTSLYTYWVFR